MLLSSCRVLFTVTLPLLGAMVPAAVAADLSGSVTDPSGAPVPGAAVAIRTAQGSIVRSATSDSGGKFKFSDLAGGTFALTVDAAGFEASTVRVSTTELHEISVRLNMAELKSEVTVTAARGTVLNASLAPEVTFVRDKTEIQARPIPTLGNALEGAPGVLVQQTTYGAVSPILRGLTGYQTLLLVDGIRFNTSIFRNGPNQYLAFINPDQADRIETILGPTADAYGSDSMGGTINVLSRGLSYVDSGWAKHGDLNLGGGSADLSGAGDGHFLLSNKGFALMGGFSARRLNDLRSGQGEDSRNVFVRYFGMSMGAVRDLRGSRVQDTGFLQLGGDAKGSFRLSENQSLTLRYQWDDMQNVRSYRDQLGGQARTLALFDPQGLHLGYARYEVLKLGFLDTLTGTFSANTQLDGFYRGGLKLTDTIQIDDARVNSYGYSGQATTHIGRHNVIAMGGDLYDDHIYCTRFQQNPVKGVQIQDRPQYPNGSRYRIGGLFVQDTTELVPNKLRANVGLRYTMVDFRTYADRNLDSQGKPLGVADSNRTFNDVTFHTGLSWDFHPNLGISGVVSRGFRAPNVNDLGSVGVVTLGYDVPTDDAIAAGALMGLDSSDTTTSTGRTITQLGAENLMNYEFGVRFHTRKIDARVQGFDAELMDPISSRTLLFPVGKVPAAVAGIPVTPLPQSAAQKAEGTVAVYTPYGPRGVHTPVNDGQTRYYGIDSRVRYAISPRWSLEGAYSYMVGRDLYPNRPTRRLPPQAGIATLRYLPSSRHFWFQTDLRFSGPQVRLNGGDIDDDRIGASRRRSDIASFFRGSYVAPYLGPGPDGKLGNADDIFTPTNETLLQIQNRVLPIGSVINGVLVTGDGTRVPLYTQSDGWWTLEFSGGKPLTERLSVNFGVANIFDQNYRAIGSGVDNPGVNAYVGLRYSF